MPNEQIANKKKNHGFWIAVVALLVLIPVTIIFSWYLGDRRYYIASVLIMVYSMIPFFISFERRKPQARELMILAIMCAIAVVARAAFVWLPHFKPIGGIIMITAMAFGPQVGFMTGSLSMLVSDMLYGQGPWTPWQMFAYGLFGFIVGILAKKGFLKDTKPLRSAIVGFIIMVLMVGPLLDTCTVFTMAQIMKDQSIAAIYIAGIPINVSQGIAVFLCVLLLSKPLVEKLNRIKKKYGILEE